MMHEKFENIHLAGYDRETVCNLTEEMKRYAVFVNQTAKHSDLEIESGHVLQV